MENRRKMTAGQPKQLSKMRTQEDHYSANGRGVALTIEEYLADCRARGLSLKTVEDAYGYALREVFLPWCVANDVATIGGLDARAITKWQGDMLTVPGRRGRLVSRYSIKSWTTSLNTFLKWARANGELGGDVVAKSPKPPRVLIEVLTRAEIEAMELKAQTERDKLIVRVLADTGIRAGELLGLRGSDLIDRDRATYLRVRGKGDKQRDVPLPRLGPRLTRFVRGQEANKRIFTTLRKRGGDTRGLTLSGLQKMVRALGREAKLTKKVYPHLLRHSFATFALQSGMNPIQLADILGHNGLTMIIRNYSHLSSRDAFDATARLLAD